MGAVKKWSTRFVVACFFLVGGIEYSVILPTMWDYLKSKGGEEWLYGVSLAGFSISNLLTGPLYGVVFDRTHKTKFIVLFANLFEIGGNFMYFAATSKYMIMGSRFIVGLGAGAGAALFAELARTSTKKSRTVIFSVFMSMRQVGLIVGPGFNLFLRTLKFDIGPFPVMKYTSPGAFMFIVWIFVEILFIFLFFELPPVIEDESTGKSPPPQLKTTPHPEHPPGSPSANIQEVTVPDESMRNYAKTISGQLGITQPTKVEVRRDENGCSASEDSPLIPHHPVKRTTSYNTNANNQNEEEGAVSVSHEHRSCWQSVKRAGSHFVWSVSELLREEMVVLLAILFITIFSQTTTEAMLVPMTENLLKWSEFENSIFFCIAGAEIIFTFVLVSILSKFVGDRWQMLGGLLVNMLGYTWLIVFTANSTHATPGILWKFIIGAVVMIFGLPLYGVTGASLYSKMLPQNIQGFGQGIRRSTFSTAAILGPLWAGGAVSFSYYILLSVPCGLLLFVTVLMLLSFTKLKEHKSDGKTDKKTDQQTNFKS